MFSVCVSKDAVWPVEVFKDFMFLFQISSICSLKKMSWLLECVSKLSSKLGIIFTMFTVIPFYSWDLPCFNWVMCLNAFWYLIHISMVLSEIISLTMQIKSFFNAHLLVLKEKEVVFAYNYEKVNPNIWNFVYFNPDSLSVLHRWAKCIIQNQ